MSIEMKKKISMSVLSVATIIAMGYSSVASAANDPLEFNTQITVSSPYDCAIDTHAAATEWDLTWTLNQLADTTGTLTYNSAPADPLAIDVTFAAGAAPTCHLDGMVISGIANGDGVTPVTGQKGFFRKKTSDGFWRYAPVLSRIRLYSSDDDATAINTALTFTDAAGTSHTQSASPTALYSAHGDITDTQVPGLEGKEGIALSDNYIAANAFVPLVGDEISLAGSGASNVRSAHVDVSAIIAKNPENEMGQEDVAAVNNNDVINLPFTVQIAYK